MKMKKKISIVQTKAIKEYDLGAKISEKNYPSLELVRLEKMFLSIIKHAGFPDLILEKKVDFEKLYNQKFN